MVMDDKEYIARFIQGECSPQEQEFVLKEAERNAEFRQLLYELKNIYVHENMPDQVATDQEYSDFKKYAMQRMLLEEPENRNEFEQFHIAAKQKNRRRTVMGIINWSAVATAIILLALNLKFNFIHSEQSAGAREVAVAQSIEETVAENVAEVPVHSLPQESVNVLYTAKGVKGETVLPDGSKVILNSDSRITYPARFSGDTREVEFSGEGYFQVQKDSLHPMVIRCNKNFKVIVYGTTFNIKTYGNDNTAKTTLISGSIKIVENVDGKELVRDIAPSQSYTIVENRQIATLETKVDTEKVCEWKDGILSFDSTPLSEVAKILERWHGIKIVVEDTAKLNIPITARFTTESIVQIMDLLKFSTDIKYSVGDNVVAIR